MRRFLRLGVASLLLASVAVASSGGATQAEARWVITDLGTLGGKSSEALALNERGQVVGWADTKTLGADGEPIYRAFVWEHGKMRDLGVWSRLPRSAAVAINDGGQVVVNAQSATEDKNGWSATRALLWTGEQMRDLGIPTAKSSVALAITERGQIVGCVGSFAGSQHQWCFYGGSFLWERGRITYLRARGGIKLNAVAVNNLGQVVGETAGSRDHAFLWASGSSHDLGTLGGKLSDATAINERSEVVGSAQTNKLNRADDYYDYGSPMRRAFIWANGRMRDLGTFGGPDGEAVDINRRGQVVGWVDTKNTSAADRHMGEVCGDGKYSHPAPHAFLWSNGRLTDLGALGGLESEADAVNDNGQVVGWADTKRKDSDGCAVGHAFVWGNGRMSDLGTLPGGLGSEAVAINNRGQIIGWSETKSGSQHAVLWTLKR